MRQKGRQTLIIGRRENGEKYEPNTECLTAVGMLRKKNQYLKAETISKVTVHS